MPELPRIVGFTGYLGSGKDTAAATLFDSGWEHVKLATPLHNACLAINPWIQVTRRHVVPSTGLTFEPGYHRFADLYYGLGWDYCKHNIPEMRETMQIVGTEGGRDIHGMDCWVNKAGEVIQEHLQLGKSVAVTDVRFHNEIDMIYDKGGIVINIVGSEQQENKVDAFNSGHRSEDASVQERFDFRIHNCSTIADLHLSVWGCVNGEVTDRTVFDSKETLGQKIAREVLKDYAEAIPDSWPPTILNPEVIENAPEKTEEGTLFGLPIVN